MLPLLLLRVDLDFAFHDLFRKQFRGPILVSTTKVGDEKETKLSQEAVDTVLLDSIRRRRRRSRAIITIINKTLLII